MATAVYDIGDRITVTTTFRDDAGVLTNPSTVVGRVRKPDGTSSDLGSANVSTGVFRITLPTFDLPGLWRWRQAGTAGLFAADEGTVYVRATGTP